MHLVLENSSQDLESIELYIFPKPTLVLKVEEIWLDQVSTKYGNHAKICLERDISVESHTYVILV